MFHLAIVVDVNSWSIRSRVGGAVLVLIGNGPTGSSKVLNDLNFLLIKFGKQVGVFSQKCGW